MSESGSRGATPEDLDFIEDICRDIALKTRSTALPYPAIARALGDALIVHRVAREGRTVALATAIDRGRELDLFLIAVSFSLRHTGIAGTLLGELMSSHLRAGKSRRIFANCWPGSGGGPGALLAAGFHPAPGKVRFTRDLLTAPTPPAEPASLQWIDARKEPIDRRARLLGAVGAAWPGDSDPVPVLAALCISEGSEVWVGKSGDDVKAALGGTRVGDGFMLLTAFEVEVGQGEGLDGGLQHLVDQLRGSGTKRILVESPIPTAAVAPTLSRIGFRSVEAAAGFLAGTPGHAFEGNAFAL